MCPDIRELIRAPPFAFALAKDPTIPIQAFEVEHLLAHMTMPSLVHPHHTVDSLDRTTGPHRLPQELIHLYIALTPIGAKPTTKDLLQDHHLM